MALSLEHSEPINPDGAALIEGPCFIHSLRNGSLDPGRHALNTIFIIGLLAGILREACSFPICVKGCLNLVYVCKLGFPRVGI